ncbi:M23 family metallopeptidase [Streptomyces sp. NPDC060194]|uniref:M23 family metallopeptidase n=1 Tax=Streptomyces sp. NPDC060194 TaxID=3347069 RepID=UPI0036626C6A
MRRKPLTRWCCAALACAASIALPSAAHAHDTPPPAPGAHGAPGAAAVAVEVERLYTRASAAAARHERARRAAAEQRVRAVRLRGLATEQRRRVASLRAALGGEARAQYRAGGGAVLLPAVRLVLEDDPEAALSGAALAQHVRRSARDLHTAAAAAQVSLARREAAEAGALRARERELRAQAAARREVRDALAAANERLRAARARERAEAMEQLRGAWMPTGDCAFRPWAGPAGAPGGWTAPVREGALSSRFGADGKHWKHRHTGQDFAVGPGTEVYAIGPGTVVAAGCGDGFGNQVVLRHADGYYSQYAHLSVINVRAGDRVGTGRRIGLSGATGNASGPHLHFEIRLTPHLGSAVDPVAWLREHGVGV